MKKLVHENKDGIKSHELFANQLVDSLNTVLDRFRASHNHFSQPITEAFALDLVSNPVSTFDSLLRMNSPVKALPGKEINIEKLAELVGIDRKKFIQDVTMVLPGSISQHNRTGIISIMQLQGKHKNLINWKDEKFVLNESELKQSFEAFRVYATTKEEKELIERWESLSESLNSHKDFIKLDAIDCNRIASMLRLDFNNGFFVPKYKDLAHQLKEMAIN